MLRRRLSLVTSLSLALLAALFTDRAQAQAQEEGFAFYPLAVLPFSERGEEVAEMGDKVTQLLFVNLATKPNLLLVDREDLGTVLGEQSLSASGLVRPDEATRIGQLTGAKLLVTGSVMQIDNNVYLVAKIIGTETTRVVGASAKGGARDELGALVEELSNQVEKAILDRADQLVAKPKSAEDQLTSIKAKLGNDRPTLWIDIDEQHVARRVVDPAAETEMTHLAVECGFPVIDQTEGEKTDADILIVGEGISQFNTRIGNMVSVIARLEVKAVDRKSGRVLAAERHVSLAVGLTEEIAGKEALQTAAAEIAGRVLARISGEKKE